MSEIIEFLITVRDERDNWKIKHSLADIVLLIFFARLSGAEFWEEIEDLELSMKLPYVVYLPWKTVFHLTTPCKVFLRP